NTIYFIAKIFSSELFGSIYFFNTNKHTNKSEYVKWMFLIYMHHTAASSAAITDVDRKSTRLNSSHVSISYAVFCLKKKNTVIKTIIDLYANARVHGVAHLI